LAVKGTASAVAKKVAAIKGVKDADSLRATYDEIVNELIKKGMKPFALPSLTNLN